VEYDRITVKYIPAKAMVTDILTKSLLKPQYVILTDGPALVPAYIRGDS
jgi:hypothetical protein